MQIQPRSNKESTRHLRELIQHIGPSPPQAPSDVTAYRAAVPRAPTAPTVRARLLLGGRVHRRHASG